MPQKILFIVFFLMLHLIKAQEADSVFIKVKGQEFSMKSVQIENYKNPALMRELNNFKYTKIKAEYNKENKETYLIQTPEGQDVFSLKAEGYSPINHKTTLWGEASYQNGTLKNQVWNETLDYDVVYPYFMADSVGGDLKMETYAFTGGISSGFKKINWGAQIDYKAELGSRGKDPRPKDTSSDLNIKAGLAYEVNNKLTVGAYVGVNKYTQSNELDFYNELGNPIVYHFNGLGSYNTLFDGTYYNTYHDGFGYNTGVQIETKDHMFSVQGQYKRQKIDKLIQSNISIEVSTLTHKNTQISLTKWLAVKRALLGIKLKYNRDQRKGVEPAFSSLSVQTADIIGYYEKFTLSDNLYELRLIYISNLDKTKWKIQPFFNIENYKENYTNPENYQNFDNMNFGVEFNYLTTFKNKHSLYLSPQVKSYINTGSSSLFNSGQDFIQAFLEKNYEVLSQDYTTLQLNAEYAIPLRSLNLAINGTLQSVLYSGDNNLTGTIGIGILF